MPSLQPLYSYHPQQHHFFLYVLHDHSFGDLLTALNVLSYVIGLVTLIFQLNMKLVKMILLINDHSKLNVFNRIQETFLMTITKLSVLMTTFASTSFIWIGITMTRNLAFNTEFMQIVDWIGYGILVVIGTSCIYLTFTFNSKSYDIICGKCNTSCYKCCMCCVRTVHGNEEVRQEIRRRKQSISVSAASIRQSRTSADPGRGRACSHSQSQSGTQSTGTSSAIKPNVAQFNNGRLQTRNRLESHSDFPSSLKREGIANASATNTITITTNDRDKSVEISLDDLGDITDLSPIQEASANLSGTTTSNQPIPTSKSDISPISDKDREVAREHRQKLSPHSGSLLTDQPSADSETIETVDTVEMETMIDRPSLDHPLPQHDPFITPIGSLQDHINITPMPMDPEEHIKYVNHGALASVQEEEIMDEEVILDAMDDADEIMRQKTLEDKRSNSKSRHQVQETPMFQHGNNQMSASIDKVVNVDAVLDHFEDLIGDDENEEDDGDMMPKIQDRVYSD